MRPLAIGDMDEGTSYRPHFNIIDSHLRNKRLGNTWERFYRRGRSKYG